MAANMQEIDLLILGAGWTSTFLIPLLEASSLSHAQTSTTGRPGTIKFTFDPSSPDQSAQFTPLPHARYVLVTFPVTSAAAATLLLDSYAATHARSASRTRYLVLGSTGIWQRAGPTATADDSPWLTRHSPHDTTVPRAQAEAAYLARGACVLNLAGLWDGSLRSPRNWVARVAKDKAAVRAKGSLHLVHGVDVARALVAVVRAWDADRDAHDEARRCKGQRWMLTDGFVYDWWALMVGWADVEGKGQPSEHCAWVYELMAETGTRALPRSMDALGRCYDTREFWNTFDLVPLKARAI